jgi:hypothetical protein
LIARPHNDRACLGAITDEIAAMVERRDPALADVADEHGTPEGLVEWLRALPQRDDTGQPDDGPKVAACRPPQRLRIPADDPNCVERAALYLGAAELLDAEPIRRLATVETPGGLHTFPTEDGEPVILDPATSRNALRAGLFRARRQRNGGTAVRVTPGQAVDWIAELASEPAAALPDGARRVDDGARAMRAALRTARPLCLAEIKDVAFVLALADREARLYGPAGRRVVRATARVLDVLDQLGQRYDLEARNLRLRIAGHEIRPDKDMLSAVGRVTGRIGYKVGLEALREKLAEVGVDAPVIQSVEQELQRENLTLGDLAKPVAVGTLGALAPEVLAGRWLAKKLL